MTLRFAYPDTCLLLPLFIEERGTTVAERIATEFTKGGELPYIISDLTRLEFASAVAKYVRIGTLGQEQARQILEAFANQCGIGFLVVSTQSADFQTASEWISRLTTSLRSFDALHLAIAHANKCILATADKQLAAAAATLNIEHYFVPYP